MEVTMHNLISHNQLADWNQKIGNLHLSIDKVNDEADLINDYYHCLIECNDNQSFCKRVCREILKQ